MSVIRAFIAIELSSEIHHRLDQVSKQLKDQLVNMPVRWVPGQNIHLTLKFLGDVSIANLDILTKILENTVSAHHSFEISAGGLGAFPKIHQPRVIWIGLEVPPELIAIQHSLELETARVGYPREERPFSPHLTLGRVSRNVSVVETQAIARALEATKVGFLGVTRVMAVNLFRSDLNPDGAVYTRIYSAHLANQIDKMI
jgi:RNA 2',3'-cyclic 3'-phosphodiesterase